MVTRSFIAVVGLALLLTSCSADAELASSMAAEQQPPATTSSLSPTSSAAPSISSSPPLSTLSSPAGSTPTLPALRQEAAAPATESTARARPCPPDALCLPTHGTDSEPADIRPDFKLTIETNASHDCVWVRGDTDRMTGERIAVAWPEGYYAKFSPLRIFNADGELLWREGEIKYMYGWWDNGAYDYYDDDWPREVIPPKCRTERVLWTLNTPHDEPRRHPGDTTAPSSTSSVITVP